MKKQFDLEDCDERVTFIEDLRGKTAVVDGKKYIISGPNIWNQTLEQKPSMRYYLKGVLKATVQLGDK